MINVNGVSLIYGTRVLFADVNLNLNPGNKYGLVGANGAGKSSFLRLLTGEEDQNDGEIIVSKNSRIGWLKQDHFRYENVSVLHTVIAGKKALFDAINEKETILANGIFDNDTGFRLAELEQIIADNDGYTADYMAKELLLGLGIEEKYHEQNLSVLSGGYKLRVLLAQSLFNNPDVLLLDEPTNHLDIDSICWLEDYLKNTYQGILVLISHDIEFMNNIVTHILDIDYGEIIEYVGNYNSFVKQKQQIMEQKLHELNYMEKKIAKMKAFIEKFRAGTRARQSQSREKQLEKIELPDIQKSSRVSPSFNFKQKRNSGKIVLKVEELSKNFGEKSIINNAKFYLNRGDKVVIIGPNGVGKSTLLKLIIGKINPDNGNYEWGYETQISYFAQDHKELLNESMSILDWLQSQATSVPMNIIRNVLGQVLFKQDDVYKNILSLSGGEGARLLLAKMMLEQGNILILDEPTNHLDIEAKEALKQSLISYPGTVIMVTHDRDFAMSVGNRIIALNGKKINDFRGSYQDYVIKNNVGSIKYFKN